MGALPPPNARRAQCEFIISLPLSLSAGVLSSICLPPQLHLYAAARQQSLLSSLLFFLFLALHQLAHQQAALPFPLLRPGTSDAGTRAFKRQRRIQWRHHFPFLSNCSKQGHRSAKLTEMGDAWDFGIDLMPSKCRAGIAGINTFYLKYHNQGRHFVILPFVS